MSAPATYPGETLSQAVARRLRGQLAELQISQLQLCELTGWGRMYIGRRLSAETSVDAADLEHLEVTVGIRAAYLLTGEGPALTRHPTLPGEPGNHRRRAKPGGLSFSGRAA